MSESMSEKNFWQKLARPFTGLAPMDGVSDAAFRFITAKYGGPDVIFTEFTPVEGICAGAVRAAYSLIYDKSEHPIVAQFFGKTPEAFYKSAFVACELGYDGIDINMGCPAKNIALKGAGAGLILDPPLAKKIVRCAKDAARDWAEGKKIGSVGLPEAILEFIKSIRPKRVARRLLPISVKTRLGYDKVIVEEWVRHIIETAPAAITIHGRTYKQGYTGLADWEAIGRAAKIIRSAGAVAIGNGDVKSLAEGRERARDYGIDGVLIGRAALGNPWVFSGSKTAEHASSFRASSSQAPDLRSRFKVASEHARKYAQVFGRGYFTPMRKHLSWYCRGFPGAAETRHKLMQADSYEEVSEIFKKALAAST